MEWPAAIHNLSEQKKGFLKGKSLNPTGLVWNTNMAAVLLFWNTDMAVVMEIFFQQCVLLLELLYLPTFSEM